METTGEGKTPQKTPQSLPPCPLKLLRPPHTTRISEPNPDDRLTTPGFACSPSVPQGTHTDSSAYLCTQKKRPPSECGNLRNVHIRPDPDLFFFLFFSGYTRICPRILQASVSGNSITLFFKYQFYIYIYLFILQASVSGNSITLFLESGGKVQPPSGVQSTRLADGTVRRTFTGTYNPSRPAGIEWPDGNKWTKSDGDDFTF